MVVPEREVAPPASETGGRDGGGSSSEGPKRRSEGASRGRDD